jgi:hypothetical protein
MEGSTRRYLLHGVLAEDGPPIALVRRGFVSTSRMYSLSVTNRYPRDLSSVISDGITALVDDNS